MTGPCNGCAGACAGFPGCVADTGGAARRRQQPAIVRAFCAAADLAASAPGAGAHRERDQEQPRGCAQPHREALFTEMCRAQKMTGNGCGCSASGGHVHSPISFWALPGRVAESPCELDALASLLVAVSLEVLCSRAEKCFCCWACPESCRSHLQVCWESCGPTFGQTQNPGVVCPIPGDCSWDNNLSTECGNWNLLKERFRFF